MRIPSKAPRKRQPISCQRCRLRKEKCDRNRRGCENCKRHNAECLWFANKAQSPTSSSNGAGNASIFSPVHDSFTPKLIQSTATTASTELPPYSASLHSCCQLADEICKTLPARKQTSLLLQRFQEVPLTMWNCVEPEELEQSFAKDWDALHSKTRRHDGSDHHSNCSISFDTLTRLLMIVAASVEMLPTTYLIAIGLIPSADKAHELIMRCIELYLACFQYCVENGEIGIALIQAVFLFNASLTDKLSLIVMIV